VVNRIGDCGAGAGDSDFTDPAGAPRGSTLVSGTSMAVTSMFPISAFTGT
jgi:hypothetical protein